MKKKSRSDASRLESISYLDVVRIGAVLFGLVFFLARGLYAAQPAREEEHEGDVEVLHEDRDVGSRYVYFLKTATQRLQLRFATDPPALVSGDRIRARGVRTNGVLALASGGATQTLASALPNTFGLQKTLVILVNFANNPVQPYTLSSAQSVVDTTSAFDLENSFGQTSLDATVVGWYTVNFNGTTCDYNTIASLAEQTAAANGVSVSTYPRRVYAFPQFSACSWWGLGSVGGNPSRAWVNGSFQLRVLGHEMGHNLGLYHSHSLSCDSASCTTSEYGDSWDIMGASSAHFNAFQKERLGWLNYDILPPITTVEADGIYSIAPYASQDADPKALKILKSIDPSTGKKTYYYVEYRAKVGFDSNSSTAVILHSATEGSGNTSNLWDLDPTTTTADWILNAGQTYEDSSAGISITLLSFDSIGATVSVSLGGGTVPQPCVQANPTVSLSPAAAWVIGVTGSYTVTVGNNDSSTCSASNFTLTAAGPNGWSAVFGSLPAVAPGSTASTTLQLTAPAGTLDGAYNFTVTAQNSSAPAYASSASGSEVCCSGTLVVGAATDKASYTRNTFVTVTVNAAVGAVPVSGAAVTVKLMAGSKTVATLTGTTNATGYAVIKYKLGMKAATGTYQVNASAAAGGYSGSNTAAIFTVTAK